MSFLTPPALLINGTAFKAMNDKRVHKGIAFACPLVAAVLWCIVVPLLFRAASALRAIDQGVEKLLGL